jgi:anti-anti-sigma factor
MWQAELQGVVRVVAWRPDIPGADVRWDLLVECLAQQLKDRWVVDLADIRLVTSEGLAHIIGAVRRVQLNGGKVAFARPSPLVAQIVRSMRLDRLVPLHPEVAAAVAALTAV